MHLPPKKILFYSTKDFELSYLKSANTTGFDVTFVKQSLNLSTVNLAKGFAIISIFTADDASAPVIEELKKEGIQYIAARSAGYDNIDIKKATELKITVANVPEYSPYSIAEHAVAMMLALNRKLILSNRQVTAHNFSLDNLIGFDLNKKTVGIIGIGRIGKIVAKILYGFGCTILAHDINPDEQLKENYKVKYVDMETLASSSEIITIHTPLNIETRHLINEEVIKKMKKGVMLINTSRGAIVHTPDIIKYIENGHIGFYGMDVYEHEKGIFFYDHSHKPINDPLLAKLMNFSNVLITPHQAFATKEALLNTAATTFYNITCWMNKNSSKNELIAQ